MEYRENLEYEEDSNDEDRSFYEDINSESLMIVSHLTDDLFLGQARKMVYERIPAERDKRFSIQQELRIYCQFHIITFLQQLLREANNRRLMVWLAVELQFHKANEESEIAFRWSSYRNQNFVFPEFLNDAERLEFIEQILCNFCSSVCYDCEEMENTQTGWVFQSLNVVHCRFTYAEPPHIVAFGARKKQIPYNPKLAPIAKYNLRDPSTHLLPKHLNLCFPAAVSIILEHKFNKHNKLSDLSCFRLKKIMDHLRYTDFITIRDAGITVTDFPQFEKQNYPFNIGLKLEYPQLQSFQGIAINVFELRFFEAHEQFCLYPIWLSANCQNENYCQFDLLKDNNTLRDLSQKKNTQPKQEHLLAILNLPRFLASFKSITQKHNNTNIYWYCCRKCCHAYKNSDYLVYKSHISKCNISKVENNRLVHKLCKPRRVQNRLIHRSEITLKNGERTRHTLYYKRGEMYKELKLLYFSAIDLESTTRALQKNPDLNCHAKIPETVEYSQEPMGFSIAHKSIHKKHPLPEVLKDVRVCFYDDNKTSQEEFYLKLFKTIRTDIPYLHDFFEETLKLDSGKPQLHELSQSERLHFFLTKRCMLCHIKFGTKKTNPKTNRPYIVRKTLDHCHLNDETTNLARLIHLPTGTTSTTETTTPHHILLKSRIRYISCQGCNLQLSMNTSSNKLRNIFYLHNGSRYDIPLLINGIALLSKHTFPQIDKHGKIIQTPFFHREPKILFKDSETPLCVRLRFSCTKLNNCPKCSLSHKERTEYYQYNNEPLRCPFSREVLLLDSYAHVNYSLANMVEDLNKTATKTNTPLRNMFETTYNYMIRKGYTEENFNFVIKKKLIMPFHKMDSIDYLLNQKEIPPKEDFVCPLKPTIEETDYSNFVKIWKMLNVSCLYEIVCLYAGLDTAELLDTIAYYFDEIYKTVGLYPAHFQTISSLAVASFLRHNKDPIQKHESLKLELLNEDLFEVFSTCLKGGYSCTFGHYANSDYGYDDEEHFKCTNYFDWNGLYGHAFQNYLPHSQFKLHTHHQPSLLFHKIKEKLVNTDIEFFKTELTQHNRGYLIQAEVTFDVTKNLESICDFGTFPILYQTLKKDLSTYQQKAAEDMKRNVDQEPKKLVSLIQEENLYTDFTENLLFMAIFHGMKFKKIFKVVEFKSFRYADHYMSYLQENRGKTQSKIVSKLLKSLTNNVNGKFHSNLTNILHTSLCTDSRKFSKEIQKENFYDYKYISKDACVIIKDHMAILCKLPIYVSAQIYANSKMIVFSGYYYIATRFAKFGNMHTRAITTDTDSYITAHSRNKSPLELLEVQNLRKNKIDKEFHTTTLAKNYVRSYLATIGPILDFSSLSQV